MPSAKWCRALFFLGFLHGFSPWESGLSGTLGTPQEIATALLRDGSIPMPRGVGNWDFPSYRELPPAKNMTKKHKNPSDMSVLTAIHLRNKQWKLINIASIQRDAEHFESIDTIQKHLSMLFPSLRLFPIFPVPQAVVREAQANFVVTSWRVDVPMVPWPDRVRWEDVKQMSTWICPWK